MSFLYGVPRPSADPYRSARGNALVGQWRSTWGLSFLLLQVSTLGHMLTIFNVNINLVSGHATQVKDLNGDEPDGFDECELCSFFVMISMVLNGNRLVHHGIYGYATHNMPDYTWDHCRRRKSQRRIADRPLIDVVV